MNDNPKSFGGITSEDDESQKQSGTSTRYSSGASTSRRRNSSEVPEKVNDDSDDEESSNGSSSTSESSDATNSKCTSETSSRSDSTSSSASYSESTISSQYSKDHSALGGEEPDVSSAAVSIAPLAESAQEGGSSVAHDGIEGDKVGDAREAKLVKSTKEDDSEVKETPAKHPLSPKRMLQRQSSQRRRRASDETLVGDGKDNDDCEYHAIEEADSDVEATLAKLAYHPKRILQRRSSQKKLLNDTAENRDARKDAENDDSCDDEEQVKSSPAKLAYPKRMLQRRSSQKKLLDATVENTDAGEDTGNDSSDEIEASPKLAFRPKRMLQRQSSRKNKAALDEKTDAGERQSSRKLKVDDGENGSCDDGEAKASKKKLAFHPKRMLQRQSSRKKVPDGKADAVDDDETDSCEDGEAEASSKKLSFHPKRMLQRQSSRKKILDEKADAVNDDEDCSCDDGEAKLSSKMLAFHPKRMLQRQSSRKMKVLDEEADAGEDAGDDSICEDGAAELCPGIGVFHPKKMLQILKGEDATEDNDAREDRASEASSVTSENAGDDDAEAIIAKYAHHPTRKEHDEIEVDKDGKGASNIPSSETSATLSSRQEKPSTSKGKNNDVPSSHLSSISSRREKIAKSKGYSSDLSTMSSQRKNDMAREEKTSKSKAHTNNSTSEEKIDEDKVAEEDFPIAEVSPEVAEDSCEAGEVETTPRKNGFQPKKILRRHSSRMNSSMKNILDVTVEKVASVTQVLDETAEKVASITADITSRPLPTKISSTHHNKPQRTNSYRRSRKILHARERAVKRREKQIISDKLRDSKRNFRPGSNSNESLRTELSQDFLDSLAMESSEVDSHYSRLDSLATELSADVDGENSGEWSGRQRKEVDSRRHGSGEWYNRQQKQVHSHHRRHVRQPVTQASHKRSISRGSEYEQRQRHVHNNNHHRIRSDGIGGVPVCSHRSTVFDSVSTNTSSLSSRIQFRGEHPRQHESINYSTYNNGGGRQEPVTWDDLDYAIEAGVRSSLADLNIQERHVDYGRDRWNTAESVPSQYSRDHSRQQESVNYGTYNGGGGGGGGQPVSWDDLGDAIEAGLQGSLKDLSFKVVKKQEWRPNAGRESNEESKFDSKPWKCPVCTYENENGQLLYCGVCNQPRT